jgi:hypothetical protein
VCYIGINAPEDTTQKEWLGSEATAQDKELVAGKIVTLVKDDVSEIERYERLLPFIFLLACARELRTRTRGVRERNAS